MSDWPIAAPMMRLSGTTASRPCSARRSCCTPLTSMCRVADSGSSDSGVGSASEPPARRRSSSMLRRAVRAARPTSSMRVLRPSSSSTTVSGITTAQPAKACIDMGSAISTEVSSTIRCGTSDNAAVGRRCDAESSVEMRRRTGLAGNKFQHGGCISRSGGFLCDFSVNFLAIAKIFLNRRKKGQLTVRATATAHHHATKMRTNLCPTK